MQAQVQLPVQVGHRTRAEEPVGAARRHKSSYQFLLMLERTPRSANTDPSNFFSTYGTASAEDFLTPVTDVCPSPNGSTECGGSSDRHVYGHARAIQFKEHALVSGHDHQVGRHR
jgi:hypothetical protein